MALTGLWLTVGETASRLGHLGVTEHQAREMAISGRLRSRLVGDHWELCTAAVEEYADEAASECAARKGEVVADTADGPSVRGGERLPDFIEDEYERNKGDL